MKSRRQRLHRSRRNHLRRRHTRRRIQYRQRGGNKAILKQIQDFMTSKGHPGIYYFMNEEDIKKGYAMIIGPRFPIQSDEEKKNAKYPYEEGLFFFDVTFPDDYPVRPPKIIFLNSTIDPENVRIHPNLYQTGLGTASGKVCLSILGTWAGPGWQPTMTLESTLLTVQSILGPNPIQNEPGFERLMPTDPRTVSYNHVAQHKSIEFSHNVFKMVLADYIRETAARNAARAARVARPAAGGAGAAPEENNNYVEFESKLPIFIQPFYDELKGHMWSSIQFYIQKKLDVMLDMHRADPPGIGKVQTVAEVHHHAHIIDYASLSGQIESFRLTIPSELRQAAAIENSSVRAALAAGAGASVAGDIFTLGRGEVERAEPVGGAGEAPKKTKAELAAERESYLQKLRNIGQNTNANFIREMNTAGLKSYILSLEAGNGNGYENGADDGLYYEEFVTNEGGNEYGNGGGGGGGEND